MIKKIFPLIFFSILLNHIPSNVSAAAATPEQVQAFFLPHDQPKVRDQLELLFKETNEQMLIAMYVLTDDEIIEQLIRLKKIMGIDVQVIFDEYAYKDNHQLMIQIMEKLLENHIVPLILPLNFPRSGTGLSPVERYGLMHNKFVVVDNRIVWTGSANFTKRALGPYSDSFNNENIVIINNKDLAEKFRTAFFDIEKEISDAYIKIIEYNAPDQITNWLKTVSRALYKYNLRFKELVDTHSKKDDLREFLKERASIAQRTALKRHGYSDIAIEYMSEQDAKNIIIEEERKRTTSSPSGTQK